MIRTDRYTYSRSCRDCAEGRWWISPDMEEIQLCAEHEAIVRGQPEWFSASESQEQGGGRRGNVSDQRPRVPAPQQDPGT